MKIRNILTTALVAAGVGILGCGPKGVSDQALATDIQAKLYADSNARSANVKVSVANGVVTLTGDVPSSDVALQVVNIANGTSGVKSVDNQLQVGAFGTAAASAPTNPAPASNLAQNSPPPAPVAAPPPAAETTRQDYRPETLTIPAGTDIGVTMIDSISSKTNRTGQTFRGSLSSPVVVDGRTVFPTGSGATILLADARGAGRIKGSSALEVRLIKIEHAGRSYDVDSSVHDEVGKGRGKQTAVRTGIGAAAGAVIGALAGGGKGAAIGSLAGGGAGAGFQLATHGQQVTIPSESRLTFSLQAPIVVELHHDHESTDRR